MYRPSLTRSSVDMVLPLNDVGRNSDGGLWYGFCSTVKLEPKLEKTLGKNSLPVKALCACKWSGARKCMQLGPCTKQ
jgi:hypothetical protein